MHPKDTPTALKSIEPYSESWSNTEITTRSNKWYKRKNSTLKNIFKVQSPGIISSKMLKNKSLQAAKLKERSKSVSKMMKNKRLREEFEGKVQNKSKVLLK